jgi:LPS-assembly protein
MPHSNRIVEVTLPLFPPARLLPCATRASRFSRNRFAWPAHHKLLFPPLAVLPLAFLPLVATAQPAALDASGIDWVSWDELTPEQKAVIDDNCCGLYVEPAFPEVPGEPGTLLLQGDSLSTTSEGLVTLEGKAQVLQQGAMIAADRGTYDRTTEVVNLQDNIRIRQPGLLLTGTTATVDRNTGTSELRNASYVMHEIAARGSADVIIYTDADGVVTIDNGVFTRCEPGDNSWLVAGSSIRLDQQSGRGTARNVTLRVKDVPVMYIPWISFPINDQRATGFLAPVIGSTRDGGLDLATPYYLNLAPNYDATLTPRVQTDRGVMLGGEFRYRGRASDQVLDMQYLPDDKRYDPALRNQPGGTSPPVPDRWLLNYDFYGVLARGWTASADYAAVSDIDYFQDFGNNGLASTSQSFLYRDARLQYLGQNWSMTAATQSFQILDPAVSPLAAPYRSLPRINVDGSWYHGSGLEYGLASEFVVFDRNLNHKRFTQAQIDAGALVTGSRLSVTPQLSLPLTAAGAFLTPTLKYKYASWNLDDQALTAPANPSRGVLTGSIDSGLIFERDVALADGGVLHTLEPRLFYLYTDYEDQSDIPVFDSSELTFSFSQLFRDDRFSGKDRVGDTNQLTLALTSRLYDPRGNEKARVSFGQIRYFEDRRVTLLNLPGQPERRSGSALVGELGYQLNANWRASSYLEWDQHDNRMQVGNFQFQYQSDINHIVNFGYRYRDDTAHLSTPGLDRTINQTDVSAVWPLNTNWGLIGRWNYDHANKRNLETIAGVEYSNCCWTLRVLARQWIDNDALFFSNIEDNNTGIFVQFELKGLGSVLGGNVSSMLNNGISGYREREYGQ